MKSQMFPLPSSFIEIQKAKQLTQANVIFKGKTKVLRFCLEKATISILVATRSEPCLWGLGKAIQPNEHSGQILIGCWQAPHLGNLLGFKPVRWPGWAISLPFIQKAPCKMCQHISTFFLDRTLHYIFL